VWETGVRLLVSQGLVEKRWADAFLLSFEGVHGFSISPSSSTGPDLLRVGTCCEVLVDDPEVVGGRDLASWGNLERFSSQWSSRLPGLGFSRGR